MGEYLTNELSILFLQELFETEGCGFNTARLLKIECGDIYLEAGDICIAARIIFENDGILYEMYYDKNTRTGESNFDRLMDNGQTLIECNIMYFDEETYTFRNRIK